MAKLTPATEIFFSQLAEYDEPLTAENAAALRGPTKQFFLTYAASPREAVFITEKKVEGYQHQVTLRCFVPKTLAQTTKPLPTMIYYPGHGFTSDLDGLHDAPCSEIAYHGDIQVILVTNTWLTPEHRFPKGREDAKAVFTNIVKHAQHYQVDIEHVFVGGDSSGATYALHVALAYPRALQALYVIAAHIDISGDSLVNVSEEIRQAQLLDKMLSAKKIGMLNALYLPEGIDSRSPDCSPLYTDFKLYRDHFPPTTVVILECDALRGEGETLVNRLKEADMTVRREFMLGLPHNGMLCRAPGAITDGINPAVRVGELIKATLTQ